MIHPDGTELRRCPNGCQEPHQVEAGEPEECEICGEYKKLFVVKNVACQACRKTMMVDALDCVEMEPGETTDEACEELCPHCGQPSGHWTESYTQNPAPRRSDPEE